MIELRQILLVADLVLKACPPVHGDGAELHLDAHHALLIVQEDGRFHDEVQAAVAVGLGLGDVVLALEERDIVLLQKGVGELVDIRREGADDAHAGDVVEIFLDALHRQREAAALELFGNALGGLEARFDALDGVAVILERKLLVENVELGLDLHHRAAVVAHQLAVGLRVALHERADLLARQAREQQTLQSAAVGAVFQCHVLFPRLCRFSLRGVTAEGRARCAHLNHTIPRRIPQALPDICAEMTGSRRKKEARRPTVSALADGIGFRRLTRGRG